MPDSETPPYHAAQQDSGAHVVADADGQAVCACGDAANAQHYAALLNQAYRRGYKAGYRAGKAA